MFGCHWHYGAGKPCQCNPECLTYGNCCADYTSHCQWQSGSWPATHSQPTQPLPNDGGEAPGPSSEDSSSTAAPSPPQSSSSSSQGEASVPSKHGAYKLDWAAQGHSFFDGWTFLNEDVNHGSAEYLSREPAVQAGVVAAHATHAIVRAGEASPQYKYKRQSARIQSNKAWKTFLVTMDYTHVPYGCGVWPAFFTLAPDAPWPNGGEIDILEYVNMEQSKSSVHMGPGCTLNKDKVNKYGGMPDRNDMNYNCLTNYPDNLGCAPNKWMRTGQQWAEHPGVVALEWTEDFLKMFWIPKWEIPHDLTSDHPDTSTWDRWVYSYYPMKESGCSPDSIKPQKLLMQIGFCGDWAGKTWSLDNNRQCQAKAQNCRAVDPLAEYAPQEDCCTQFIWDHDKSHGTDKYLHERAFFNITYLKVYTKR
mmetsp:Transcript_12383/g.30898  ORF Transcript_12383/g.30898 Transcript_12383/m.30898 type:complete len:419 (+) Transcript_12383:63-1319(+)